MPTSPPTATGRPEAAGHMLDAIERLTDDHVRRHAQPWHGLWVDGFGDPDHPSNSDLVERIDAAIKSLIAAKLELTTSHRQQLEVTP